MPTEELTEISESPAAGAAIPGWLWSGTLRAVPAAAFRPDPAVDVPGIVAGLGALLEAMANPSSLGCE